MNNELIQPANSLVSPEQVKDFRANCQAFIEKLNAAPTIDSLDKTPDGRANTILISHIEMLLDEYFFGLWETENFKWNVIANEVVGSIDLAFIHPVTGHRMKRTGAAAIQIMVDKVPEDIKDNPAMKNKWALNPDNKKSSALDMGFPKLKAECLKNAANSLGKMFGRDINRKKQDSFKPLLKVDTSIQIENLKRLANGNHV